MHLLDITTARSSSQNHIFTQRAQSLLHNKFLFGNDKRLAFRWKSFQVLRKDKEFDAGRLELKQSGLLIRAVATLEQILSARINGGHVGCDNLEFGATFGITRGVQHEYSSEEFEEVDEKEKLRRLRISKANKGNTPWNKGRKHSAETLQRIKERTRIAMQDPKVKMKLVNLGHAQSKETRVKIGVGVRMGWERRREKLKLQETCYFEWQNLLADASRRGFADEKELQWDSYKILDKQLEQEWLESVERRKRAPRPKGSKRAPKSLEQRRKISEAISAKWADPGYRDRVCSALSKYYDTPVGVERKPRRRQSGERQARIQTPTKKKAKDADRFADNMTMRENPRTKLGRSNVPLYKDPLASSKLEMIKNIRAQRAAAELKKTEAIKQAKLLIAEAEKAAKCLEATAMKSPLAQASLIESRELIAEAIQSLQSIENGQIDAEHGKNPSVDKEKSPIISGVSQTDHGEINGFGKPNLLGFINGKEEEALVSTRFKVNGLLYVEKELLRMGTVDDLGLLSPSEVRDRKEQFMSFTEQLHQIGVKGKNSCEEKLSLPNGAQVYSNEKGSPLNSVTKKWVRGRLVEIVEKE